MKRQELQADFDRIKAQIKLLKTSVGEVPDEIISLGSQQACVNICGSLEQSLKSIFIEYAKRRSNNRIYRPIEKVCESYQNPKTSKILDLISLFDADYERELSEYWKTENEQEKSSLDNLVADRINIAHRKRNHIDITSVKLDAYYASYRNLLTRIYEHFLR